MNAGGVVALVRAAVGGVMTAVPYPGCALFRAV